MLIEDMLNSAIENKAKESIDIKETEIGLVKSVNPIIINSGGLELNYDDLYINIDLLEHKEYFSEISGNVESSGGTTSIKINNGYITFKNKLNVGDKVAMRETDDGRYYVSSKVKGGY